jgi:hypothetical protein
MSIDYSGDTATFIDIVSVEEAEGLLEWLQTHHRAALDLSSCRHLHAANLQVLLAARPTIAAWPEEENLAQWLRNTLNQGENQ